MNRTSAVLLTCAAFLAGGVLTVMYFRAQTCEDSMYVLDLHGAEFGSSANDEAEFKRAIQPPKATFRRNMHLQTTPNGPFTQPSGYENFGSTCFLTSEGKLAGGLHVTQRVGFNKKEDMEEALKHLK